MYDLIDRCVDPAAGIYSPPPYVCIVRVCVCVFVFSRGIITCFDDDDHHVDSHNDLITITG